MPLAKAGTFAQPSGKRLVARNLSFARRSVAVRVEVIRISGGRRERRGDVLAVEVVYRVVALVMPPPAPALPPASGLAAGLAVAVGVAVAVALAVAVAVAQEGVLALASAAMRRASYLSFGW